MEENKQSKKAGLRVYGVPGNTDYGYGSLDTGEYLKKLQGQQGRQTYDEMRKSDPQVQAVLKALTLPIRKASFYVEPASDSAKDKEIAEIIQNNLFEEMSVTWDDTLRHTLLMLPFGFSILEKVWHVKDDLYKIKKLDPRLPISIVEWDYDKEKRRLIGPVQQDTDGKEYNLPIEKILVFTVDKEGDNWEGTSVLRSAYKPWYIKNKLEKINAIKHDRHGVGIPVISTPPGVKEGSQEWRDAQNLGEGIYAHEKMYVLEADGYRFRLESASGGKGGTDILPSITYYDQGIAKAMLAMFIDLGTSETGSRALGGSFIEVFMDSLQAYAGYVCEVISRFLIREYCDYNWYVDDYPVLKVGKIKNLDTHTIGVLVKTGVITPDEALEASVREELNLPEKVVEEVVEPEEDDADQDNDNEMDEIPEEEDGEDGEGAGEENPDEDSTALAEKVARDKLKDADQSILLDELKKRALPEELLLKVREHMGVDSEDSRARPAKQGFKNALQTSRFLDNNLTLEEQIPDLVAIEMRLNNSSRDTRATVLNIREAQAKDIITQIVAGRKPNKIRVIQKKEMYDTLMKEYKVQIKEGRAEVKSEISSQKKLAGTLAEGGAPETYQEFIEYADSKFQVEVEGAGNKLTSELLLLALSYTRQGISGQALETALLGNWEDSISPQTWNKMSDGAVNGGWGAGRTIEGNRHKEEISYAYYSSVLDKNTCAWCWQKDGTKHEVGDPDYATPSPECAGTENLCRCITIYVIKEVAA